MQNLTFSDWGTFKNFEHMDGIEHQGTYVLGIFDDSPDSSFNPAVSNIVYVGETTQKLKKRLKDFSGSAFQRKDGHSGGWTFSDEYLGSNPVKSAPENLYVAIYCPEGDATLKKALAKYAERWVILQYTREHGKYPVCNKT